MLAFGSFNFCLNLIFMDSTLIIERVVVYGPQEVSKLCQYLFSEADDYLRLFSRVQGLFCQYLRQEAPFFQHASFQLDIQLLNYVSSLSKIKDHYIWQGRVQLLKSEEIYINLFCPFVTYIRNCIVSGVVIVDCLQIKAYPFGIEMSSCPL